VSRRGGRGDGPSPDAAWRTLGLMNDWIKHADAKAGITLAATGTGAVLLFNLTKSIPPDSQWLYFTPSAVCTALLLWTAFCCTKALIPRTKSTDEVVSSQTLKQKNPLFYGDIATGWKRESYVRLASRLSMDNESLIAHLGAQIHVNGDIATIKFRWTNRAVRWLAVAAAALAAVAVCVLVSNA